MWIERLQEGNVYRVYRDSRREMYIEYKRY